VKLTDLFEQGGAIGAVVSTHNGRFYDIDFVDYNTMQSLSGHLANLGKYFIRHIQDNDEFQYVAPFFKQMFQGKQLGEEYSSEDADFVLYGPMTEQQLSSLIDTFERFMKQ